MSMRPGVIAAAVAISLVANDARAQIPATCSAERTVTIVPGPSTRPAP
jgi:hypothetical protein